MKKGWFNFGKNKNIPEGVSRILEDGIMFANQALMLI
jgi:hypothetical protein